MRESFSAKDLGEVKQSETTTPAGPQSHRIDLSERLKLKPAYNNPSSGKTEDTIDPDDTDSNQEQPEPSTGTDKQKPGAEPSAEFTDGKGSIEDETADAEDFINNIAQKLDETEAIELAGMLVTLFDGVRGMFGPSLYEGLNYPGQERNDIRGVIAKSIENEKANKAPDDGFNNYEKRLYSKWPTYRKAVENIPYTEAQMKKLSELIGRKLKDKPISNMLHENMWLIYALSIEIGKASPIAGNRIQDVITKKFNSDKA